MKCRSSVHQGKPQIMHIQDGHKEVADVENDGELKVQKNPKNVTMFDIVHF